MYRVRPCQKQDCEMVSLSCLSVYLLNTRPVCKARVFCEGAAYRIVDPTEELVAHIVLGGRLHSPSEVCHVDILLIRKPKREWWYWRVDDLLLPRSELVGNVGTLPRTFRSWMHSAGSRGSVVATAYEDHKERLLRNSCCTVSESGSTASAISA
jgi:hypothetical protein